ncbi:MAG: DUF2726 domain-containing protein [Planctomycetaceae bacterium]|nr:DUF2726 domain-containing protein [Planctomycetaceae bacterium]
MKSRLLNRYEEITYDALRRSCEEHGAHVYPKVRVADVFKIQNSGISTSHYGYALKSHFDFVVTDEDYQPLFCVEFDGPLHQVDSDQQTRDRLKNEICHHFNHGLLRINQRYLTPTYRGLDLLTYFVDAWFLEVAFSEAQEAGSIRWDEPFEMTFIYSAGSGKVWPYWISLDIQHKLEKLHTQGRIGQSAPSHFVGTDSDGTYHCISWVVIDPNTVVAVRTGMRAQQFPAVCVSELISMLAMFDLHPEVLRAVNGNDQLKKDRRSFFLHELPEFEGRLRMACSASIGATV